MSPIWTFDGIEKKHDVYRGKGYLKKFCKSLREHAMKIKKENYTLKKWTTGIEWKRKNLLHLK